MIRNLGNVIIKWEGKLTFIELLVVLSVIVLVLTIFWPALNKSCHPPHYVCDSNQHQIHLVLTMYADDHDGFFSPTIVAQVFASERVHDWPNYLNYCARPPANEVGHMGVLYTYLDEYSPKTKALMCPAALRDPVDYQRANKDFSSETDLAIVTSYNFLWGGYEFPTIGFKGAQSFLESSDYDLILSDVMNYWTSERVVVVASTQRQRSDSQAEVFGGAHDELWWSCAIDPVA